MLCSNLLQLLLDTAHDHLIFIYKEDCLYGCLSVSISVCLNAFAQFSRYEAQTSQAGQELGGAGCAGVENSTVPLGVQE